MRIWAIADFHLSFAKPKPMEVFGERWRDHPTKIAAAWRAMVASDDLVLLAGDTSWALKLPDALVDLAWIAALPGQKVLTKGNHDYWWDMARKRRAELPPSLTLIEADAVICGDWVLCGTRAWLTPGHPSFDPTTDERIYNRELGRLERALESAKRLSGGVKPIGVLLHYPPFYPDARPTRFAELLAAAGVAFCVYGHLHRRADWNVAVQGVRQGVRYHLTAADYLNFAPSLIVDAEGRIAERSLPG